METERGGRGFFIHNRGEGLAEMGTLIQGLCPDLNWLCTRTNGR